MKTHSRASGHRLSAERPAEGKPQMTRSPSVSESLKCIVCATLGIVFSKFRNSPFFLSRGETDKGGEKNICEMLKGFILSFPTVLIIGL